MTRTLRNNTDKTHLTTLFAYAPIPPAAKGPAPSGLIGGSRKPTKVRKAFDLAN